MRISGLRTIGLSAMVAVSALGCAARPAAGPASATAHAASAQGRSDVGESADKAAAAVSITLAPNARTGAVHVEIDLKDRAPKRWSLATGGALGSAAARDARGAVEVAVETSGSSFVLDAKRAIEPPLTITYDVTPVEGSGGCPFEVSPDTAAFCGARVVAVPGEGSDARDSVRLALRHEGEFYADAASSFGLEDELVAKASFDDVARATFVFGALGHATFVAPEGRDHAAWVGFYSFDPRWAAAEAAGVRTMTDRWLGVRRPAGEPSVGLLFTQTRGHGRALDVAPAFRGATVRADVSAQWSARARLDVARVFAQRTIGGSIRVTGEGADGAAARVWFDEGVAHAVALDVLRDAGILTRDELVAEVNSWLTEQALSPARGSSVEALGATMAATSSAGSSAAKSPAERMQAFRLLAVRGALLGLALSDPSDPSLMKLSKELTKRLESTGTLSLASAEMLGKIEAIAGDRGAALRSAFERGEDVPIRATDLGSCVSLVDRKVYRFDLGFTFEATKEGSFTVLEVTPGSAASRAGLRPKSVLLSMEYEPDHADVPVIVVVDDEAHSKISYLPRGASAKAKLLSVTKSAACASGL